jgi:transposase
MLAVPGNARIFICKDATDMRKSFESLSAIVEALFDEELTSGAYFVFLSKYKNRMKVLYWDLDGLAIWYKRLEKGSFPKKNDQNEMIERREFLMLLEGVTPQHIQKRYKLR